MPAYFDCLTRHHVTHVFNYWTEMPPISDQMALIGSKTNSDLVAARFLIKPGRKYEEAVQAFEPYEEIQEVNEEARRAGAALILDGRRNSKQTVFIFVNNRLEGNALQTIQEMLEVAGAQ
jgi:hypothetical protein